MYIIHTCLETIYCFTDPNLITAQSILILNNLEKNISVLKHVVQLKSNEDHYGNKLNCVFLKFDRQNKEPF